MSTKKDMKIVSDGKVKKKTVKLTDAKFNKIAEHIGKELDRRKNQKEREDAEKSWAVIDRQLAIKPDVTFKLLPDGQPDPGRTWMPEVELPMQSIAYEVLTADIRKLRFPDSGSWFMANVETTDQYLRDAQADVRITGDENDLPSQINQDNADKLVQGFMSHLMRQYEFENHYDLIDGESIKYGMGVGRAVMVKKTTQMNTAKGIVKVDTEIPVLVPRTIKNIYPDTRKFAVLNSGFWLSGSTIEVNKLSLSDLTIAANAGSKSPDSMNGGWMPRMLKGVHGTGSENDDIEVIEYEGDLIIAFNNKENFVARNVIITVIRGQASAEDTTAVTRVIRWRFSKFTRNSYLFHPYNPEHIDQPYSPGVLGKGSHVQLAATEALNRLLQATAYDAEPTLVYDSEDPDMEASGGPKIHPGAKIGAASGIDVLDIGNPTGLFTVYSGFLQQYSDVTGITPSRLGAQTLSHTTKFAKQAEIIQGENRTRDYVVSTFKGACAEWLDLCYQMGRENLKGKVSVWIEEYGGFVEFSKKALPENVVFQVFGAGTPIEENQEIARQTAARAEAVQIELLRIQAGLQPRLDLDKLQDAALRTGGISDIDAFINETRSPPVSQGTPDGTPVPGASSNVANALPAAIQTLGAQG